MAGGRPREIGEEVCSCQGSDKLGFTYFTTVNRDGDVYFYPHFRHNDRTIKDHAVEDWGPTQNVAEYYRISGDVTTYGLKGAHRSKGSPVVVYDFHRLKQNKEFPDFVGLCGICYGHCNHIHDLLCDICNETTICWCPTCQQHWDFSGLINAHRLDSRTSHHERDLEAELNNSGIQFLKLEDLRWFLKTSKKIATTAREFLLRLSSLLEDSNQNIIITYGENANKETERIAMSFHCDFANFIDKYGILKKLGKKIQLRKKQEHIYNHPAHTLPEPVDYPD
jgi:hypothetical protein